MRQFSGLIAFLSMAFAAAPGALHAEDDAAATRHFATVKLFFVNQYLPEPRLDAKRAEGFSAGGMGGMDATQLRFETVRLFLDGKFIGHAMLRHVDVKPTLNLPTGEHHFRIECDGYRDFETKLEVLQNGSTQWLVIELEREETAERSSGNGVVEPAVDVRPGESQDFFIRPLDDRSQPSDEIEKGMKADELERRKRIEQRLRERPLENSEPDSGIPGSKRIEKLKPIEK